MNYFVEGIQGSGKSTMVAKLSKEHPDYAVFHEGDYSPIELAWCAYLTEAQYTEVIEKYEQIKEDIEKKTVQEGDRKVVMYTQIITDVPGFHKHMEQYESYNGRLSSDAFEEIVLKRFSKWKDDKQIFECSLFQNIIENQILYLEMSDEQIIEFYRKVAKTLEGKSYRLVYLQVDDIRATEEVIRKERSDAQGNELWFPLMIRYIEESPYGKRNHLIGMDGLVSHLEHRIALEKTIIDKLFAGCTTIRERKIKTS